MTVTVLGYQIFVNIQDIKSIVSWHIAFFDFISPFTP